MATFWAMVAVMGSFFLAQWEEYHTGTLSAANDYYGVTEAQFTVMLVHIITAICTPAFWRMDLIANPLTGEMLMIRDVLVAACIVSNAILSGSMLIGVIGAKAMHGKSHEDGEDMGKKKLSLGATIFQLFPITLLFAGSYVWITNPNDAPFFHRYPTPYIGTMGLAASFLSSRIIVSHMCKTA